MERMEVRRKVEKKNACASNHSEEGTKLKPDKQLDPSAVL
jgi:hypothetical protein